MRFVEWNCCEGFASDLPALLELGCDLAVLCEVPEMPPPVNLIDPEIDWHWAGRYPRKGLAIASFGGPLTRGAERIGAGSFTVSAETKAGIGILGIWTCPPRGSSYGAQARATIDTYADWLRDTPSIVAGDFNVAPRGIEDTRTGVLRALFADLDALGYRSVYHHYFGEEYGAETRATYFHRRRPAEPFHIDFVFLHQDLLPQVRAVEVGTYERWVARRNEYVAGHSDHVPIVVDLDLCSGLRRVPEPCPGALHVAIGFAAGTDGPVRWVCSRRVRSGGWAR